MRDRLKSVLVAAAVLAVALCAPGSAQGLTTLRVAMIPIEPASTVYYAKEMGFFARHGLDVDVTQNQSTPAIASAVVTGTYDIAYATISTLADAHAKGLPFVAIAPGVGDIPGHPAGFIMLPMDGTEKTGKDFNGKTFGTAGLNTLAEYLPRAWIDKHGGDSSTIKFIEMPFPVQAAAIAAGRVDAAYLTEPFITIAEKNHQAKKLTDGSDAIAPRYLSTAWYTTRAWASAHPDLVGKFRSAILETNAWANKNPDKVIPILAKYLKVSPEITAQAQRPYNMEELTARELQPWIDVTARYAKFKAFPASEMMYASKP